MTQIGEKVHLAILGSGEIFYSIINKISSSTHFIEAIATNSNSKIDVEKLENLELENKIYKNHKEIFKYKKHIDLFLMCSYEPLIEAEYYENHSFINIHFTLLPRFRGFHGLIWSMINDEKHMGYSIFQINEVIDGGLIFFQHSMEIQDFMDMSYVRTYLENHLESNIVSYIDEIENGKEPNKQDEADAIYVTKRGPDDGYISWDWESRLIFNHIRALVPPQTPGAYTLYKGKRIVISKAEYVDGERYYAKPGKIVNRETNGVVVVKCGDGVIKIHEIIVDNVKQLPTDYFKMVGIQLN